MGRRSAAIILLGLFTAAGVAHGQGTSGPTVSDSKVGYIDAASPLDQFRIRYDAGFDNNRPSRAEYFYARTGPNGPGLPLPESNVDHQDISVYWEATIGVRSSIFVELPVRWLNPDINDNSSGMGDMNVGFKRVWVNTPGAVLTWIGRVYIPTGEADRGLGNGHISIEPGLLFFRQLTERLTLEGELKYWLPIDNSSFTGDIIRYGLGLHYNLWQSGERSIAPVVEVVGWQVLDGQESAARLSTGGVLVGATEDAAGDAIVNLKVGVRAGLSDRADFYAGWGRSLTGDRWYRDIVRLELRLFY